jgi:hypothetical protein
METAGIPNLRESGQDKHPPKANSKFSQHSLQKRIPANHQSKTSLLSRLTGILTNPQPQLLS